MGDARTQGRGILAKAPQRCLSLLLCSSLLLSLMTVIVGLAEIARVAVYLHVPLQPCHPHLGLADCCIAALSACWSGEDLPWKLSLHPQGSEMWAVGVLLVVVVVGLLQVVQARVVGGGSAQTCPPVPCGRYCG